MEDKLLDIINYHNNTEHSSTKYKPCDLINTTDLELIKRVNENISKTINYAIKHKNLYLLEENEFILINNNIIAKKIMDNDNYEILKKNKKISGEFIIPGIFKSYTKDYRLKVIIKKDYKKILKKERIYIISSDLCRLVSKYGYDYYFK